MLTHGAIPIRHHTKIYNISLFGRNTLPVAKSFPPIRSQHHVNFSPLQFSSLICRPYTTIDTLRSKMYKIRSSSPSSLKKNKENNMKLEYNNNIDNIRKRVYLFANVNQIQQKQLFSATGNLSRKSIFEDDDGNNNKDGNHRTKDSNATSTSTNGSSTNNMKKDTTHLNVNNHHNITKKDANESSTSTYNRGVFKTPIISTLWAERSRKMETDNPFLKSHSDTIAQNKGVTSHLIPKAPSESYIEIDYNFTTDYFLKQAYTNAWGSFRKGKLLEDMDALAGNIAQIHCHVDGYALPLLVTASCDKISMKYDYSTDNHVSMMDVGNFTTHSTRYHRDKEVYNLNHVDMKLSGQVIYTGKSSLQILLGIRKKDNISGNNQNWMTALFTFVARDPMTNKAIPINPLDLSSLSEKENKLYRQAVESVSVTKERSRQKKMAQKDLEKLTETEKQMFLRQQQRRNFMIASLMNASKPLLEMPCLADSMCILLDKTKIVHNHIMEPQQRNMLDRIFGGYLMRKSFEIAFTCAYLFGGSQPEFVSLNHVDFILPVDVGDLVRLESSVLYTTVNSHAPPMLHIQVVASICKPEVQTSKVSNVFDYTFQLPETLTCKKVLPSNYSDAARIVDRILSEEDIEDQER